MKKLNIGQAEKTSGLPAKTIRFYEEEGLIDSKRGENGYRVFDKKTIDQLKLIKTARELGLPLTEVKKLMIGCCENGKCKHSGNEIAQGIDDFLIRLSKQQEQMAKLKGLLERFRREMQSERSEKKYCCNVLNQLLDLETEGGEDNG